MGEFEVIEDYLSKLTGPEGLGLGDDAAIFDNVRGTQNVIASDTLVENVHFFSSDPPDDVGRKLMRCNLSDLAAMGAKPRGWLLNMVLPSHIDKRWIAKFCEGLKKEQQDFSLRLWGGDTTSTAGPVVLSGTFLGSVSKDGAVRRNGACIGDGIWVTGTIGDGALGLQACQGKLKDPTGYLRRRYHYPCPRIGLPLSGLAHAAMDVSDGLVADLTHLARASKVHIKLVEDAIPLSAAARIYRPTYMPLMLTGGDDYEIVFAVPPVREKSLFAYPYLPTINGEVAIHRIGECLPPPAGVTLSDARGHTRKFSKGGWRHF